MNQKPRAYDAYQELADAYAAHIDTKPHNAYYDRPAVISLWPDVSGCTVLDAGCGPGVYTEELVARGATGVAVDISERMLEFARTRLNVSTKNTAFELQLVDLTQPLDLFSDAEFHLVNAPLCLDYIEDWRSLFNEFLRVLKPGGKLVFSCGHPAFDAEYFNTNNYFSVEAVESTWTGFGKDVLMPSYRRSWEQLITPIIESGLVLERVHEPLPTDQFKAADPVRYQGLMHRPGFVCVRASKPLE